MRNGTSLQVGEMEIFDPQYKAASKAFEDYARHKSGPAVSTEAAVVTLLRGRYPDHEVTVTSHNIIALSHSEHAEARLDIDTEDYSARRNYSSAGTRKSERPGRMDDKVIFGRYFYRWNGEDFIVYRARWFEVYEYVTIYCILHKRGHELVDGRCKETDDLIAAAEGWENNAHEEVWVYDQEHWTKNSELFASIQNASWDDVIMDKGMKEALVNDVEGFFDSEMDYKEFAVPWKRGVVLYGLPGNGKTISIKALMRSLYKRADPIPTLYVKSLAGCRGPEYAVREIFKKARQSTPCLLVLEDLDSLVTDKVKSFFLNEIDGLESNEGLMILGSTNYLERLDPGISKRPGRFDRKYHFSLPAKPERVQYCHYWKDKLKNNKKIDFPSSLCEAIAEITEGFSFAYLKETFITSLLMIVGSYRGTSKEIDSLLETKKDGSELDHLLLWRVMQKQITNLRFEMEESRKLAEEAARDGKDNKESKSAVSYNYKHIPPRIDDD